MRPSLSTKFVDKAAAAITSAVEVYNKPTFRYREETFAILALNAWELLLKAKILKGNGNRPKSLWVFEPRAKKGGGHTDKLYAKKNRAGNNFTIALSRCVVVLDADAATRLAPEVKANLDALVAIRDNSSHYVNHNPPLARQTLEIASASIKNFVLLMKRWFAWDLSASLSLSIPLCFVAGTREVDSVIVNADEQRLMEHLRDLARTPSAEGSDYCAAIRVDIRLVRSTSDASSQVSTTGGPDAVRVLVSEADIKKQYPWTYRMLVDKLIARYKDFKQNRRFHSLRRSIDGNEKLSKFRYLDPDNPTSSKQQFFSPNILQFFDGHYTKV